MTVITSADAAQSATAASPAKINADFNMFLKLLTTQMQHQDPLSPMDTSQYTQQLVQFSQVEQSIEQTQTLKSILGSLGTQNLTQASSLIGRQVETNSAMTGLGDAPAQWTWSASRDVASLTASVVDAKGKVVDTFPLNGGAARGTVTWDGVTAGGVKLPGGGYGLTIKGLDSSGNEVPLTVNGAGRVSDVQLSKGSVLVTVNGARFGIDELTRIGE